MIKNILLHVIRYSNNLLKKIFLAGKAKLRNLLRFLKRSIARFVYGDSISNAQKTAFNIRRRKLPLKLEVVDSAPARVNVVISMINFTYFFGGYISVFSLAKMIAKGGFKVRIIIVDECNYTPELWRREIKKYQGLEDFFDLVEVSYHYDRSIALQVNPDDKFLATSAWTAHIAHQASQKLGHERFVYLTQEYEPLFHDSGSIYNVVNNSYSLSHYAIYSTELYREFARNNQIGVFNNSTNGDDFSVVIENSIHKSRITREILERRKSERKKMLCYTRPEPHARRNMFIMMVMAFQEAIDQNIFNPEEWEFFGMGTVEHGGKIIEIAPGIEMKLLERVDLNTYIDMLPEYDLGLSLMSSPHPSLPPLDMAAAGMITVTNTFANKTKEKLEKISTNLIPVNPDSASIVEGLRKAVARIDDIDARIAGTNLNWKRTWDETLNSEVMSQITGFLLS